MNLRASRSERACDLRSALVTLQKLGDTPIIVDQELDPKFEIARHYLVNFATSPANSRSGDEPMVIYTNPIGSDIPVLMGLFGARSRSEMLLDCERGDGTKAIGRELSMRTPVKIVCNGPSQAIDLPGKLSDLPILTVTPLDAGPYLTSGLVLARDPETGVANVSIHRMRILNSGELTIWMLPGRDLQQMHQKAANAGKSLPISINIGADPIVYLTSSISAPFLKNHESELELAGGILGQAIEVSTCKTQDTWCLANSEIVLEGEITNDTCDEFEGSDTRFGMPEFLGYMGGAKEKLPLVKITKVTSRIDPIYQTFLGPGKEQSELLALPTEAGMLIQMQSEISDLADVYDAHYLASSGGQLTLILQVLLKSNDDNVCKSILDAAIRNHSLVKSILLVDLDVDIHSESDLFWAMSTRFQPSRDLIVISNQPGFPLDPSQSPGYIEGTSCPTTDKYLMDLTSPIEKRSQFRRLTEII